MHQWLNSEDLGCLVTGAHGNRAVPLTPSPSHFFAPGSSPPSSSKTQGKSAKREVKTLSVHWAFSLCFTELLGLIGHLDKVWICFRLDVLQKPNHLFPRSYKSECLKYPNSCRKDVLAYRTTFPCQMYKTYFIISSDILRKLREKAFAEHCM